MTGHDNGLITLALEEADDAEREKRRTIDARALPHAARAFPPRGRALFLGRAGARRRPDRRLPQDFRRRNGRLRPGAAKHYANGAPPNWQDNFISAYATSHPWEDFAETWAHYLHIVDTLEMARAFGMYVHPRLARPGEADAQVDFDPYSVRDPAPLIDTWIPLSNALNSLNRTMGLPDIYPFVLSPVVVAEAQRHPRSCSRQ